MDPIYCLLGVMVLLITVLFVCSFVEMFRNERILKKFRENLKVGDETDEGVIIAINGFNVITEKTSRIEGLRPSDWKNK